MGQMQTHGDGPNFITGQMVEFATGRKIDFQIRIEDRYAFAKFSDELVGKKMVIHEQKLGNKNIKWSPVLKAVVEHYPDLNKAEITALIKRKLDEAGIENK